LKTGVFLILEKLLARFATDRIVVISQQQFTEIHEKFGVGAREKFAIIPLGIDTSVFSNRETRRHLLRKEIGAAETDILVGIVGRLTEIKNHEMFLRAIVTYKERYQYKKGTGNVRFVIIGEGHLRKQIEEKAVSLGISDRELIFTGSRNDPEVFYAGLDIVALTSHNEGTPLTLIEAMANALACVATAVGGVIDVLGSTVRDLSEPTQAYKVCERGIAVASGNVAAFCDAMQLLIADPQLRNVLGENGRKFVNSRHSHERLLKDIDALYSSLIAEHGVDSSENTYRHKGLKNSN